MQEGLVEIARFRAGGPLKHCQDVLDEAGIAHRVAHDAPVFDIMAIGRGSDSSAFIVVLEADEERARYALLDNARKSTTVASLREHYFKDSSDADLLEVVRLPADWGPEDVAAAECLLKDRQVTFSPITYTKTSPEPDQADLVNESGEPVLEGTKSGGMLIAAGYIFGCGFGLYSFIMGWQFLHSRQKNAEGQLQYVYNPTTRVHGAWLMAYSVAILSLLTFIAWSSKMSFGSVFGP